MLATVLQLSLCTAGASPLEAAKQRFEVVGVSDSHVAMREFYDVYSRSHAEDPVSCGYPGLAQLAKKRVRWKRASGVRLHFLGYRPGDPLYMPTTGDAALAARVYEQDEKGKVSIRRVAPVPPKTFTIYASVLARADCTSAAESAKSLKSAKAYAQRVAIDLDAPLKYEEPGSGAVPRSCRGNPECAQSETDIKWKGVGFPSGDVDMGEMTVARIRLEERSGRYIEVEHSHADNTNVSFAGVGRYTGGSRDVYTLAFTRLYMGIEITVPFMVVSRW